MHLKKLTEDDIFLVTFKEREILDSNSLLRLERQLQNFTTKKKNIIFDFQNIEFVDSTTIRALIGLQKKLSKNKGTIKLANLTSTVQNIFEITRLRHILDIYPSVEEAIASLRSSSSGRVADVDHVTVMAKNPTQNALLVRIEGTESLNDSNAGEIKAKLSKIIGKKRNVILNLENISFIDSSGIKALAFCLHEIRKSGGGLKLSSLQPPVLALLETTGWDKVIEIYENDEKAISSLTPSDKGKKLKASEIRRSGKDHHLIRYHDVEFLLD